METFIEGADANFSSQINNFCNKIDTYKVVLGLDDDAVDAQLGRTRDRGEGQGAGRPVGGRGRTSGGPRVCVRRRCTDILLHRDREGRSNLRVRKRVEI